MGCYHRVSEKVMQECKNFSTVNQIRSNHMQLILTREGGMDDHEANKVVKYLEQDGYVTIGRLD